MTSQSPGWAKRFWRGFVRQLTADMKNPIDYLPSVIVLVALAGFWRVSQVQVGKLETRIDRLEGMLEVKPSDVLARIEEMEAKLLEAIE